MTGYDHGGYLMYLAQVPMFRACSKDELEEVAALGQPRQAHAGEDLVRQGEHGDEFFVLATGEAKVVRDGKEVATIGPGGYFGELALFEPGPRNATVTATKAITAVALPRAAFETLLNDVSTMRDAILRGMAHRLHELDGKA